jgi:hypothetical protein
MNGQYSAKSGNGNASADIAFVTVASELEIHVQAINELTVKLKDLTDETDDVQRALGEHICAIRAADPSAWETVVKDRCGLSRSRAYELMAIADGIKTTEQTRRERNLRQFRHRQKHVVRYVTDKQALAAAQAQILELKAAHAREISRYKAAIAQLGDGGTLKFERDGAHAALGKVAKILSEARGLSGHFVHNKTEIIAKISRANMIATSALQPAKAVTCKPADLVVKRAA